MRVKKLHFEDYKRFHDLTIDLGEKPARIVALVGPNGCGKSSVFDGMLYINNAYGVIGGSRNTANDYRYHSLNQERNYNYQKNSIKFDEGSLGYMVFTADVFNVFNSTVELNGIIIFR